MYIKNELNKLYAKEMPRKDFLSYMGGIFLTVIGVSGLMRALLHSGQGLNLHKQVVTSGYGSTPYGGNAESAPSH